VLTYLLALAGFVVLFYLWRRDQQATAHRHATFFSACDGILDDAMLRPGTLGYPVLSGHWRGLAVEAEPIVDCLGVRKLPSLWLKVTVLAPVATAATLDLMMRPLGSEFFSPHDSLAHRIETPADWPERAILRSDDPAGLPPLHLLDAHVGLFEQGEAKELVVAPKGVRIVWQADEAERSDFLLLRQARFSKGPIDRQVLADIIARCAAIRDSLNPSALAQAAE
jgi:hypothetical protein